MTRYLHFINESSATTRNESLADELGCGIVTQLWFNQLSHADGRRAFEVVNPDHESYLNHAERDALVDTLWYRNTLSGDIYVATNGAQNGDGSIGDPVNLATVCSALSTVAAGSTVHVQSGIYVGDFDFIHSGTAQNRITITVESGARIRGSWSVSGNYLTVSNVDVYDEPSTRWTEDPHGTPIIAHDGVYITGTNAIIVHPKVQDVVLNGCGFWQPSINSVLYGLWTINNGWNAPDRGHGHGTYTQNEASGSKLLRNCIWAQGYAGGVRAYSTNQAMQSVTIDRCISINDQIHLGGHSPASDCEVTNNRIYNDGLEIGETDRDNVDVVVTGNYVVNSINTRCAVFRFWDDLTITGNTFVLRQTNNLGTMFEYLKQNPTSETIDNNTYYYQPRVDNQYFIIYDYSTEPPTVSVLTIAQWQALGYDQNSSFIEGLPTVNEIFVEHSEYDNDIAHVAIYNWQGLENVPVDFSGGNFTLTNTYRAYNAMNPDEYHQFVYDGSPVSIPMNGWSRAIPVGDDEPLTEDTWPTFGAFVVKLAP